MAVFRKELSMEMDKMRNKFRNKSSKLGTELDSASSNMMTRVTGRKTIKSEVREMDKASKLRAQLAEAATLAGTHGYCLPRHRMPFNSSNEGSKSVL